jgi:hypothetical protein
MSGRLNWRFEKYIICEYPFFSHLPYSTSFETEIAPINSVAIWDLGQ